ncbi:hypothetical protein ACLB90_19635 [Stenotrophomonas sp. LGBM10]|uniref:hypothetical protein n=1 Tax=Stenotrophomonas sp. LGBM10 TaxID=3390038 RepID=UPI00398B6663
MKNWLIGVVVTLAWTSPCLAQIAPELLGGADPDKPMFSESFYKGGEGSWVLVREPVNTGYHCSVNFITPESTFSLRGPADAGMARKGHGGVWFISKAIPPVTKSEIAPITLSSTNHPTQSVEAAHVSLPGQSSGALLLTIDVKKSVKEKPDSNELAIQFQGKEVFRSKVVQLQLAYRQLSACMSAARK